MRCLGEVHAFEPYLRAGHVVLTSNARRLMNETPTDTTLDPGAAIPAVVRVLSFLMVSQVLCGFWLAGMFFVAPPTGEGWESGRLGIAAALALVWRIFCSAILVRPLLKRQTAAWAGVQSILISSALSSMALLPVAAGRRPGLQPADFVRLSVEAALAVWLFNTRGWFDVAPGEAGRTLWRRGWWALTITSALDLLYLGAYIQAATR